MKKAWASIAAVALCALSAAAAAQTPSTGSGQVYPAKPVKIVVGFAAGGPTDVIARILAADMSASVGQSFIVENRPGANAIIATEAVAHSAPDGYTTLFSSLSLLVNPGDTGSTTNFIRPANFTVQFQRIFGSAVVSETKFGYNQSNRNSIRLAMPARSSEIA